MKTTNYLSINDVIGEHYIILDILAKDAFEILYLVRDTNRTESLFVLKELFFETFCSREDNIVIIQSQAQGVFYKQKQAIISKVNKVKNHQPTELKTFGFFEENNTIYTIMEYSTDAKMSDYLEFETETLSTEKVLKTSNYINSLKYLLALGLVLLLAYLGYMAYKNYTKTEIFNDNDLKPRIELRDHTQNIQKEVKVLKTEKDNIEKNNINKDNSQITATPPTPLVKEKSLTLEVNKTSIENNISTVPTKTHLQTVVDNLVEENNVSHEENLSKPLVEEKSDNNNTAIPNLEVNQTSLSETEIKTFLDAFINSSSNGSIDEVLSFYDTKIEKYFKFNHINQDVVKKDKLKYNKKWVYREFTIEDFKILKQYIHNKQEYVHLQTITKWTISNKQGLKRKGKSKGFMKVKLTDEGLRVVSIYGLN